jgi:hypothetical protein
MNNMKPTLMALALIILFQMQIVAQPAGGPPGMGMQPGGAPSMVDIKFDHSKMAGIIIHDFNQIEKKLKIKVDSQRLVLYKIIGEHNNTMYDLRDTYQPIFDMLDSQAKRSIQQGNMNAMRENMGGPPQELMELKKQTDQLNNQLKIAVSKELSEKQKKKWNNYIKSRESENGMPKMPTNRMAPPSGGRMPQGRFD